MQIIGTAGHVDHGKSSLVERLTGIHPDRLQAEQEREMTIELGFAWFELPNGDEIGIVDVPGHRDFIENMLAGIGGIDAALFVVAADEGVMPQTREHLDILNLLQVSAGVIALTKTDLIKEPEWLDLIEADLKETLAGTVLADAPIVRVSARSGAGMDALINTLQVVLSEHPSRPDLGRPRLPIDRVFTLPGFGTIVTGTLTDGQLSVGDSIEILPQKIEGRIRGLQTHREAEEKAFPGGRTAVNISGISVDQIERGQVLAHTGTYQPSKMLDVWCTLLPDLNSPLKHNTEVKLFLGAAEVIATVRLLGVQELAPGKDAFLQLILQEPIVALRQDRFIIRRPSPPATIGGGQVVDPHPKRRHKRFNADRLDELERLLIGTPEEILFQTAQKSAPTSLEKLLEGSGLQSKSAEAAAKALFADGVLIELNGKRLVSTADFIARESEKIKEIIATYHQHYPLRPGMAREQLKSHLGMPADVFDALVKRLSAEDVLEEIGALVRRHGHRIVFSESQQAQVDKLLKVFDAQPTTPPSVNQSIEMIGEELVNALVATETLIRLGEEILFQRDVFEAMQAAVIAHIKAEGAITLAALRDQFNTSRKYAVAVLEHLDQSGVTIRKGDSRQLRRKI